MSVVTADTPLAAAGRATATGTPATELALRAVLTAGAFGLYWLSAIVLQQRGATLIFGNDAYLYEMLLKGTPVDRITRFHPLTTALIEVWVRLAAPLTAWFTPQALYKALFAAVGAAGVWAATAAFAAVGLRRQALLWGAVYAISAGVWYFSSVAESKIVTTTLVAFYIVAYLRLRTAWSARGAVLLTALLLLACLNEIVSAFLVVIPAIDAVVQYGWNVRTQIVRNWWIVCHALAAPIAFLFIELVVNGWLVPVGHNPEGASHLSMLLYYFTQRELSAAAGYDFAVRWLFFNLAAPSIDATHGAIGRYGGDFPPGLGGYLDSPVSVGLIVLFGAVLAVGLLRPYRGRIGRDMAGIVLGVLAFAVLRAAFFFVVFPGEHMLFASATTLPHMFLIAIPFAVSSYPRKQALLAGLAALLFIVNGAFILGP